jgi:proteasome lid subunit RPN8/RPN11
MLLVPSTAYARIVAHCIDGLPDEACGLLAGDASGGQVRVVYPTRNLAGSAKLYTVDPRQHLQADRDAEQRGMEIMGVFHSHTHTDAYPSPTDVAQAPDPDWHYVLVSLRDCRPVLRSFRIVRARISEEPVVLRPR